MVNQESDSDKDKKTINRLSKDAINTYKSIKGDVSLGQKNYGDAYIADSVIKDTNKDETYRVARADKVERFGFFSYKKTISFHDTSVSTATQSNNGVTPLPKEEITVAKVTREVKIGGFTIFRSTVGTSTKNGEEQNKGFFGKVRGFFGVGKKYTKKLNSTETHIQPLVVETPEVETPKVKTPEVKLEMPKPKQVISTTSPVMPARPAPRPRENNVEEPSPKVQIYTAEKELGVPKLCELSDVEKQKELDEVRNLVPPTTPMSYTASFPAFDMPLPVGQSLNKEPNKATTGSEESPFGEKIILKTVPKVEGVPDYNLGNDHHFAVKEYGPSTEAEAKAAERPPVSQEKPSIDPKKSVREKAAFFGEQIKAAAGNPAEPPTSSIMDKNQSVNRQ